MSRDNEYLLDILDAARLALDYVRGKTEDGFLADVQCQDAVVRRLEVIGEASRRISDEAKSVLPHIPWGSMTGMRNIMIHRYDDVGVEDRVGGGEPVPSAARESHRNSPWRPER